MLLKFIIRLLIWTVCTYIALTAVCLFYADPAMQNCELKQERRNRERLARLVGSRLVLVGGSNVMYGFNSPRIERTFGIPVVNLGLHAGFGLIFQLDAVKRNLHKGDVVVLLPEYANFDSNGSCYGKMVMISAITDILSMKDVGLPWQCWAHNWFAIPQLGARKAMHFLRIRKGAGDVPDSWWNEQGDTIRHWNCDTPTFKPSSGSPSQVAPCDDVVRYMHEFKEFAESKGAKVFLFPPAFTETGYNGDLKYYDKIAKLMQRSGFPFRAPLGRYAFADELIYDSPYHLNRRGLEERTRRFIEDIGPLMDECVTNGKIGK